MKQKNYKQPVASIHVQIYTTQQSKASHTTERTTTNTVRNLSPPLSKLKSTFTFTGLYVVIRVGTLFE